jgi:hypothetical protein
LQIFRTVVVASLFILFVLEVAFNGQTTALEFRSYQPPYDDYSYFFWISRAVDVGTAFYSVYLVGLLVVLAATLPLRSVSESRLGANMSRHKS